MVSDWKEVKLQDVVSILGDGLHGTPKYSEDGEYYFINGSNLDNGKIIFSDTTKKVDHEQYLKYKKDLNDRTLLVSINGTIGNVAYYNGEKVVLGKSACYFNLHEGIEKRYVRYVLSSHYFTSYLYSFATGTTIKNVSLKSMREFKFKLPPLLEQKAIAHILGTLDDKIELNHQMNETLEAMAQALFKSWFVDFDPVIDNALLAGKAIPEPLKERAELRQAQLDSGKAKTNSEINDLFPNEFEFTEELGWIPKGWSVDSVDNLIEINPRLTLKKGTLASHADMKALPESGFNIDGVIEKEYSGGTKFQNRDVLFARITPCLENGKTGLVDFLEPGEVGFGSTEFIVLREKDNITMEFVACLARNNKFRLHAIQSMVGSSGRQRVQNSCFSDFYMALPKSSNKVLELFHEMTSVNFEKISIQAKESRTLAKLRDTLLPKLMSGELRIPDAERLVEDI